MSEQKLSKKSVLAMLEGTRTEQFLNSLPEWEVLSFNSATREIRLRIKSNYGYKTTSIIIPMKSPIFKAP